ncbi:MAG: hypothetical protein HY059_00630 [Proteobacteria bacterium]|nr:hypothetical protein [Pseudomonadota bacterium]
MRRTALVLVAGSALLLGGCGGLTRQQAYVGSGAAIGAAVGALTTGGTSTLQGAAIGAAVGAAGGYVIDRLRRPAGQR